MAVTTATYSGRFIRPLDLQAGHPISSSWPRWSGQERSFRERGWEVCPVPRPAVGQAAGLGAQPPVAAASPDDGGEEALAGVAHAQGPVAEYLDLQGEAWHRAGWPPLSASPGAGPPG